MRILKCQNKKNVELLPPGAIFQPPKPGVLKLSKLGQFAVPQIIDGQSIVLKKTTKSYAYCTHLILR